jgi:hypothetical protein
MTVTQTIEPLPSIETTTEPTPPPPVELPSSTVPTETETPTYETPTPQAPPSAYYRNCSEARAAGAAPLYRGAPGYRSALDRDDDGVACE